MHRNSLQVQSRFPTLEPAELPPPWPLALPPRTRIGILGIGGLGGSGKVAHDVALALSGAGAWVLHLSGECSRWRNASRVRFRGVSVPDTPRAPDPRWVEPLAAELAGIARAAELDLLQVHYCAGMLDAALRARDALAREGRRLSVVATLHGTDVTEWGRHTLHGPALAEQLRRADLVTTVSEWLAARAVETFGSAPSPRVIHNAVDTPSYLPSAAARLRRTWAPRGELLLAHVSNLRPVKRAGDALRTLARVYARGLPARLVILGEGPGLADLREQAHALGVDGAVVFAGAQPSDRIPECLAACDLLLVTSETESFSLVALEAMGCGVPVVSSRCGGPEELFREDETLRRYAPRLLVDVGDSEAMAAAVVGLARAPALYARIQERCRTLPARRFPRRRQTAGYLSAFADAVRPWR